ncbi:protein DETOXIFICATION 49-like [Diospyros lotus]|uniref:protein DETOXIFICATION 49-like n=1 Tax=Diospyros lotus TaxID=55363 RepID=UPI002255A7E1|nr:protein DETOXIFICATION 49-like [Diospyros lotus]
MYHLLGEEGQEPHLLNPLIPTNQYVDHQNQAVENEADKASDNDISLVVTEAQSIAKISFPVVFTLVCLYMRSMVSMLFLGRLGSLALAGGSLSLGFANITGYSVLSGLAMGMEPICGQAFGAKKYSLLSVSLQRSVLLLISTSFPIALIWINMKKILLFCGQDESIAKEAQVYILYSLPDLFAQSLLHPLKIYLQTQSKTFPLPICAAISMILHVPINYFLVSKLSLGIKGVALGGVWFNFNYAASLIIYILVSGIYKETWRSFSFECLRGWKSLLNLAIPSCCSVCLEWWWYELITVLSGWLANPTVTVASMGILIQTTSLIYSFPSSLSSGVSTRVGNELGAGRPARAKLAAIIGLCSGFIVGFVALAFAVSMRKLWATFFTDDEEIIALTSLVLPILGICELGNCPQTACSGVVRGTARLGVGAKINFGCFYVIGLPVAIGLGFFTGFGFEGLWLGLLAAQSSCAVAMVVVLATTDWNFQALRAQELTANQIVDDEDESSGDLG